MSKNTLLMELDNMISDAIRQGVPEADVQELIEERGEVQRVIDELEPFNS